MEVQQLKDILGLDRVMEAMRAALARMNSDHERTNHYKSRLTDHIAPPCRICGKPLDTASGYPCGCRRPTMPCPYTPPPPAARPLPTSSCDVIPKFRRSKNLQTGFNTVDLQRRVKRQVATSAQTEQGNSHAPGPAPHTEGRVECTRKKLLQDIITIAESDKRKLQSYSKKTDSQAEFATSPSSPMFAPMSRRSRRKKPQGDRKLAMLLTACELLHPED